MKTKFTNQENANDSFIFDSNALELPNQIHLTKTGRIVKPVNFGQKGYAENIEYELSITSRKGVVHIDYYGEDDTWLSNIYPNWVKEIMKKFNNLI
jgi:hypothetical protein